jgi:endonuclease/exonuclease/phosphatase (EEP) superfamily protein YafD
MALLAFALGYFSSLSAVFDFFAQFSAHWLLLAVVAVAASFATRCAYTILALSLLIATVTPLIVTSWHTASSAAITSIAAPALGDAPISTPEDSVSRRKFKLLTFNTYNLNNDLNSIWGKIQRHNADVVLLIEFGPSKKALLPRLKASYPHYKSCQWDWNCAIGLFSRLPVQKFMVVAPNDDIGPSLISADIELAGSPVTIIGAHILSPIHGPRANFIELDYLTGAPGTALTRLSWRVISTPPYGPMPSIISAASRG